MKTAAARTGETRTAQPTGVLLIIMSALVSSVGQMCYKLYYTEGWLFLAGGLLLYVVGGAFMMAAFRFGKLSVLQPMLSLANVFAVFLAVLVLGEAVTEMRLFGVALVITGSVLIGGARD